MKILLAVDDSKFSQAAVQAVITNHQKPGLEVRVLHAAEPPALFTAPEMAEYIPPEETAKQANAIVAKAADALRAAGVNASTAILQGDPKSVIIDEAAAWGADLIVLGSHGKKGLERFLLGSVSDAVVRHALCSVEVVRLPSK